MPTGYVLINCESGGKFYLSIPFLQQVWVY